MSARKHDATGMWMWTDFTHGQCFYAQEVASAKSGDATANIQSQQMYFFSALGCNIMQPLISRYQNINTSWFITHADHRRALRCIHRPDDRRARWEGAVQSMARLRQNR